MVRSWSIAALNLFPKLIRFFQVRNGTTPGGFGAREESRNGARNHGDRDPPLAACFDSPVSDIRTEGGSDDNHHSHGSQTGPSRAKARASAQGKQLNSSCRTSHRLTHPTEYNISAPPLLKLACELPLCRRHTLTLFLLCFYFRLHSQQAKQVVTPQHDLEARRGAGCRQPSRCTSSRVLLL
ncbi:uncharacterized protein LY89DRAFT_301135 [Mollisia scopiformis]|uniref:Uncharacterized protein n=1 Tax=Mollisia scopiformis TaxID=149040 RepID=A0A194XQQ6_MOLSC|nr:uncharacterized protein LY89DRAFT_301135 [Mollisia scopiformis]KUJ22501.1 hypothetical protein LY89DRAFT_301135 [Mollisia scopiformis]